MVYQSPAQTYFYQKDIIAWQFAIGNGGKLWQNDGKTVEKMRWLLNMAIYSWFSHRKMVMFHSYVNVYQRVTGVGTCPFLRILNITFKYLLEIISPIVGWCSIGKFTKACLKAMNLTWKNWDNCHKKKVVNMKLFKYINISSALVLFPEEDTQLLRCPSLKYAK